MKKKDNAHQFLINLRNLRKARGLSINNLAEKVGADYQQIGRIERGQTQLTVDLLYKLSAVLETPISNILGKSATDSEIASSENENIIAAISSDGKENSPTFIIPEIFKELENLCSKNNFLIDSADLVQISAIIYTCTLKVNFGEDNLHQQMLKFFFQALDTIFEKLVLTKVH